MSNSKLLEQYIKQTLNELVSNPIVYLKNYLTMTDVEKGSDMARRDLYQFAEWLEIEFEFELEEETATIIHALEEDDYERAEDVINTIAKSHPDAMEKYHHSNSEMAQYSDAPSYLHMSFQEIIKNQWLIHFTDASYDIASEGFTQGVDDFATLGLTTHMSDAMKSYGGYNFAYRIDDYTSYGKVSGYGSHGSGWKYGTECVVFRASGILVDHFGDQEPQVIFFGNTAHDIIPITNSYDKWQVRSVKTMEPLFSDDKLETVVAWVIDNFEQYRKHLTGQ